jgi:hypothetical protein
MIESTTWADLVPYAFSVLGGIVIGIGIVTVCSGNKEEDAYMNGYYEGIKVGEKIAEGEEK